MQAEFQLHNRRQGSTKREISLKSHNWQETFVNWNEKIDIKKKLTQEMIIMILGRN